MPLQNRVLPTSEIVIDRAYRGMLMGNRGCLHDDQRNLVRQTAPEIRWIACLTEFKGRKRRLMTPGYYTELFFLDEATALAAGHRPCFECRRSEAQEFKTCWLKGNASLNIHANCPIGRIDSILQAERLENNVKKTYEADLETLPDGTMVELDDALYLVQAHMLAPWSASGYGPASSALNRPVVKVLTPKSIVHAMHAGYRPRLHPTAGNLFR